jgi:hypothetical protein
VERMMLGHTLPMKLCELPQRHSICDGFTQLPVVPVLGNAAPVAASIHVDRSWVNPRARSRRTFSTICCRSSRNLEMACSSGSRRTPCRINFHSAILICHAAALDTVSSLA